MQELVGNYYKHLHENLIPKWTFCVEGDVCGDYDKSLKEEGFYKSTNFIANNICTVLSIQGTSIEFSYGEHYLQQQDRYQNLNHQEKYELSLLRRGQVSLLEKQHQRIFTNYRTTDCAVWLLMHHHPLNEDFIHIATDLYMQYPDLLSSEDWKLLEHGLHLHYLIKNEDDIDCLRYLQTIPVEQQSHLIQTYKQLLLASCDHHNGRSLYIPYMEILGHNPIIDMSEADFFADTGSGGRERFVAPTPGEIQSLPIINTPLERLFHDILYLYAAAPYRPDTERLSLMQTNSTHGFVDPKHRVLYAYFRTEKPERRQNKSGDISQSDIVTGDPYLEKQIQLMKQIHISIQELIKTCREVLYNNKSKFTQAEITRKIIKDAIGEFHFSYFMRHLTSESDNTDYLSSGYEGIIENNFSKQHALHYKKNKALILTSQWRYAFQTSILLSLKNNDPLVYIYPGLNNYHKHFIIRYAQDNNRLYDYNSLIELMRRIKIVPYSVIHVTHNRVIKALYTSVSKKRFSTATLPQSSCLIHLQEEVCIEETNKLMHHLEEVRQIIHAAIQGLHKYPFSIDTYPQSNFSINEFFCRIVDCLRFLKKQNLDEYEKFKSHMQEKNQEYPLFKNFLSNKLAS